MAVAVSKFSETEERVPSGELVTVARVNRIVVVSAGFNDCAIVPSSLASLGDSPTTTTVGLLAVAAFVTVTEAAAFRVGCRVDV